jgi:putative acetyltransferase
MIIREFRKEDIRAVMMLHHGTVNTINSAHYSEKQRTAWSMKTRDPERSSEGLLSRLSYVAEEDGTILGFASGNRKGEVTSVYTSVDSQGKGAGSKLLARLEAEMKKEGVVESYLDSTITAHTFYQKQGYKDSHEHMKDLAGEKFQIYHMKKKLV